MNKFEEAKVLAKMAEKIEASAFDATIDYKPWERDLEPSSYAEWGFIKGQQRLLEELLEKGIINGWDIQKLMDDD